MTLIHAIILGVVEGITEFLPISSTAHLMMTARLFVLPQTNFLKTFEIVIQFGAILAVVMLYRKRFAALKEVWTKIAAAFIPTALVGFVLYKIIKTYFLGNDALALWALGIGGVLLIIFEVIHTDRTPTLDGLSEIKALSYRKAVLIGLAQSVAVIPGVSRSAATIVAGLALGLSRAVIIEFSFLLAVPTMLAASGYELYKSGPTVTGTEIGYLIVGFVVAFLSAYFSIRWFLRYVQTHNFILFGLYRIVIALLFIPLL